MVDVLVVTYLVLALGFAWFVGLEDLFVVAAVSVGFVLILRFFLWGNPGVPMAS